MRTGIEAAWEQYIQSIPVLQSHSPRILSRRSASKIASLLSSNQVGKPYYWGVHVLDQRGKCFTG